ncbi:MAG: hypothetical protein ACI8RP_001091 [Urechidicola sp.]|jgi:hypothetical protein
MKHKFNPNNKIGLNFIIASSLILGIYFFGTILWIINEAAHGFPDRFPDNFWRGINIILNPQHPIMILYFLIGNILFFSIIIPLFYLLNKKN